MGQSQLEFEAFYAAAKDDCLRTVLACTGDLHRAEDLVAEAFARAWASWGRVSRHPAPRAWIVRTALNQGVSVWRRRRRELPLAELTGWEPAVDAARPCAKPSAVRSMTCGCGFPRARWRRAVTGSARAAG